MAGFLRKKTRPAPQAAAPPAPPSTTSPTPLFARFASSQPEPQRAVVSSPMLLSSARSQNRGSKIITTTTAAAPPPPPPQPQPQQQQQQQRRQASTAVRSNFVDTPDARLYDGHRTPDPIPNRTEPYTPSLPASSHPTPQHLPPPTPVQKIPAPVLPTDRHLLTSPFVSGASPTPPQNSNLLTRGQFVDHNVFAIRPVAVSAEPSSQQQTSSAQEPAFLPSSHRRLTQAPQPQPRIPDLLDDEDEDSFLRSPPVEYQQQPQAVGNNVSNNMGANSSALHPHGPSHTFQWMNNRVHSPPLPAPPLPPPPIPQHQHYLHMSSPPRKSTSVRASVHAQAQNGILGKPLIFTAMASVDQRPLPPTKPQPQPQPQPQSHQVAHLHTRAQSPAVARRLSVAAAAAGGAPSLLPHANGNNVGVWAGPTTTPSTNGNGNARNTNVRTQPQPQYPPAEGNVNVNTNGRLPARKESLSVQQRAGVMSGGGYGYVGPNGYASSPPPPPPPPPQTAMTPGNGHAMNGNGNGYTHQQPQPRQHPHYQHALLPQLPAQNYHGLPQPSPPQQLMDGYNTPAPRAPPNNMFDSTQGSVSVRRVGGGGGARAEFQAQSQLQTQPQFQAPPRPQLPAQSQPQFQPTQQPGTQLQFQPQPQTQQQQQQQVIPPTQQMKMMMQIRPPGQLAAYGTDVHVDDGVDAPKRDTSSGAQRSSVHGSSCPGAQGYSSVGGTQTPRRGSPVKEQQHQRQERSTPVREQQHQQQHQRQERGSPVKEQQWRQQESPGRVHVKMVQVEGADAGLLDRDPFAKAEGVRMLGVGNGMEEGLSGGLRKSKSRESLSVKRPKSREGEGGGKRPKSRESVKRPKSRGTTTTTRAVAEEEEFHSADEGEDMIAVDSGPGGEGGGAVRVGVVIPPTPGSPDKRACEPVAVVNPPPMGATELGTELGTMMDSTRTVTPPIVAAADEDSQDRLTPFLTEPHLLRHLLEFLSFYDWCMVLSLSRAARFLLVRGAPLRETVLERFLRTVGYARWAWADVPEPLSLSLQDLSDYMRGVSTPTHEYARIAALYVHSLSVHPQHRDMALYDTVRNLSGATRAYTRVVLRLRAQAEKEASVARARVNGRAGSSSRPPSRAPSPTTSAMSHSNQSHAIRIVSHSSSPLPPPPLLSHSSPALSFSTPSLGTFQSPLFRMRRAPLLRVFVPSPDGDWLSDKSVLECEAECRKAGVAHLMRIGDVVWDVAVGDEGNVGRLVWDGSYLIDLDYTYSAVGDLPKYMPALAFPPSYFHRVIRTGQASSNPIVHVNLQPWGEEIATNLQLLQDRVRTETPQGAYHNLVRWVHRSSFVIRPPPRMRSPPNAYHQRAGGAGAGVPAHPPPARIPIPDSNLFVDPGWYGTVVVETEGTNESLADLQDRCGPGVFPPRPRSVGGYKGPLSVEKEGRLVFRILREKSRPGEIWIRAVSPKERLL